MRPNASIADVDLFLSFKSGEDDGGEGQGDLLVNVFTGETVIRRNRFLSYWRPVQKTKDQPAEIALNDYEYLPPAEYASRVGPLHSTRPFTVNRMKEEDASTVLAACLRGFLARRRLRTLITSRYIPTLSFESGLIYFIDTWMGTSCWHKPRLALRNDLLLEVNMNPEEDSLVIIAPKRSTFSSQSQLQGPFRRRWGAGQRSVVQPVHSAFLIDSSRRKLAERNIEISDSSFPFGETKVWLDDFVAKDVLIDDYATIRCGFLKEGGNNWRSVLDTMKKYPSRALLQVHGMRCFVKGNVPIDPISGMLTAEGEEALDYLLTVITNAEQSYGATEVSTALEALCNMCSVRAGRAAFFSTAEVTVEGPQRKAAIRHLHKTKLNLLHAYVLHLR